MRKTFVILIACTALAAPAWAENFSVVGSWSSMPLHNEYEAPFWTTTLAEASGGDITVELTTHNQMGLGLGDIYPLLGQGVYDLGMTVADYAVTDAPELEGLDVPLVALTADEARAMIDADRAIPRVVGSLHASDAASARWLGPGRDSDEYGQVEQPDARDADVDPGSDQDRI
jgi:TRAP-type C4-dicarboxylate transport system substrate-binding protein